MFSVSSKFSKKSLLWVLISVLVVASASFSVIWYRSWLAEKELNERLRRAANFLLIQYNPHLNLCCEAPFVAPNTYWLASDNLLAYHALEPFHPFISNQIYSRLEMLDGFKSGLYEALFGESISLPVKEKVTYIIERKECYVIKTDIHNSTTAFPDWNEYANLLVCAALSLYWEGNETEAFGLFDEAVDMWDGKGLYDRVIEEAEPNLRGLYETYKLALLLYASRILERRLPFKSELESILWANQREEDGGIVTHYNGSVTPIVPKGDANTETTSLTLIAYTYSPGAPDQESSEVESLYVEICALTSLNDSKQRKVFK